MAKSAKSPSNKPMTKSEIFSSIAEGSELSRKQVATVFGQLEGLIQKSLGKRGSGMFTLPGLCKMSLVKKPATKARKGRNPFTGEEIMIKAKPARNVVKIRPLKNLKQAVA